MKRNIIAGILSAFSCICLLQNNAIKKVKADTNTYEVEVNKYCNENRNVTSNEALEMTSNDRYLKRYLNSLGDYESKYLYDNTESCKKLISSRKDLPSIDDAIVNFIPRHCFTTVGTYSYIGTEYGFCIDTYKLVDGTYNCEFLFVDVEIVKSVYSKVDSNPQGVTFKPLFSGICYYDPNFDVVYYTQPCANSLSIGDISVCANIMPVDSNIDLKYGMQFYSFNYESQCSSYMSDIEILGEKAISLVLDIGEYALTCAITKKMGFDESKVCDFIVGEEVSSITDKISEWVFDKIHDNISLKDSAKYNVEYTGTENGNKYILRENYRPFAPTEIENPRTIEIGAISSDCDKDGKSTKPILYRLSNDDYYDLSFSIGPNYKNGVFSSNTSYMDCKIPSLINLNYKMSFYKEKGSLQYMDTCYGGSTSYFDFNPKYTTKELIEGVTTDYGYSGEGKFTFTPQISDNYTLETFYTNDDTVIELVSWYGAVLTTVDNCSDYEQVIDEGTDNEKIKKCCSKLVYNLVANKQYQINVYTKNERNTTTKGQGKILISRSGTTKYLKESTGIIDDNEKLNTYYKNSIVQEFIPKRHDVYTFFTTGAYDTTLKIYDWNHELITSDDDSGYSLNAKVSVYLEKQKTYYVESKLYSGTNKTFGVYVINEINVCSILFGKTDCEQNLVLDSNKEINALYIRVEILDEDVSTTVRTTYISGYDDLYMRIYKENLTTMVSEDDDSGVTTGLFWTKSNTKCPKISYDFKSKSIYYIVITPKENDKGNCKFNLIMHK